MIADWVIFTAATAIVLSFLLIRPKTWRRYIKHIETLMFATKSYGNIAGDVKGAMGENGIFPKVFWTFRV
jgi:hypothetical protein